MDNSSFGEYTDFFMPSEMTRLSTQGATSETFAVRIFGKWHFQKRPKEELNSHPQYLIAFEKEFDLGYTLDHPNIVRYISKGTDESGFYFLTEYVEGLTLTDFIEQYPNYFKQKENRKRFIRQLLSAISYLHGRQILHLDLKPDNLLITNIGNNVKIIDLGFAYSDCHRFFSTGYTRRYAAPEQLQNGKLGPETDIYAIGKLLSLLPNLSFREKRCFKRCLRPLLSERYHNVEELSSDLFKKSHVLTTVIALLAVVALLLFGFWNNQKQEKPPFSLPEPDSLYHAANTPVEPKETPVIRDTIIIKEPISLPPTPDTTPTKSSFDQKQEIVAQFRKELQRTYSSNTHTLYSLQARYQKWEATQNRINVYLNDIATENEKEALSKLLYREENIQSALYIQQSVIAELNALLSIPLPEEKTAESILLAFNKAIAPHYIPFYTKYRLIEDRETYNQAKRELDAIKKETEAMLQTVFFDHPEVYSSREIFYEKFMARLPNYPYYNYIYPAEDLLRNYLFLYE